MTTPLNKAVSRECVCTGRRYAGKFRQLVVTLLPGDVIEFREKGTQHRLLLAVDAGYSCAAKMKAREIQAERRARRKTR